MQLCSEKYDCRFFLATGTKNEEQEILKEILNSKFQNKCLALDQLDLIDILPIIKNCKIFCLQRLKFQSLVSSAGNTNHCLNVRHSFTLWKLQSENVFNYSRW